MARKLPTISVINKQNKNVASDDTVVSAHTCVCTHRTAGPILAFSMHLY